jgi:hypothetical protein
VLGLRIKDTSSSSSPSKVVDYSEIEVDLTEEEVLTEVEVSVRVIMDEEKRFSIILKRAANDKIKSIAEELAELLAISKYSLTFFFRGEKVNLGERLGDRAIGGRTNNESDDFLLCLKGGSEGPKIWKRFTHVDDPVR